MDFSQPHTTHTPEETKTLGRTVASYVIDQYTGQHARIICFYGNLGSGKTTFIQGMATALGYQGRLVSPTYVLMKQYDLPNGSTLMHFDLYRLHEGVGNLHALSLDEVFADPRNIVLIEWADRLENKLPQRRIDIHCEAKEDGHVIRVTEIM